MRNKTWTVARAPNVAYPLWTTGPLAELCPIFASSQANVVPRGT